MTKAEKHTQEVVVPRAVKNFRKILADKSVKSVEQKDGWTYLHFKNGQIFGCRGPVVDAALTGDALAEKPVKDYWKPKKGEGIGFITIDVAGIPAKRKQVFIEAEFEHFGEKFFIYKNRAGFRVVTHTATGGAITQPTEGKIADVVKIARERLDKLGVEKFALVLQNNKYAPEALAAIPLDETIGD